jgi:hypothetical protein
VDTVAEGEQGWDDVVQIITLAIRQDKSSGEPRALARRTLGGMLKLAAKGQHLGGKPSYGYRIEYREVEVPGKGVQLKPFRYVPDGIKADAVKLIFRLYDEGRPLREIAAELFARGVPSPMGHPRWPIPGLLKVLKRRKYTGDWCWGERAVGKYSRQTGGQVRKREADEPRFGLNAPEDCVIVNATHEPLVDHEVFARVQARLSGNQRVGGKEPGSCGNFLLSKILTCGHCGALMLGYAERGRRMYCCGGYLRYGPTHCRKHSVPEKPFEGLIVRKLQETFLNAENLARLRADAAAAEQALRGEDALGKLERRLAVLEQKIAQGDARLLELPADRLPGAVAALRALEAERDAMAAEADRLQQASPVKDMEERIAETEAALWDLQEALASEDMLALREVFRQMVSKVVLYFEHYETTHTKRSRFSHGVLYRRLDSDLVISVPSGCRGRHRTPGSSCGGPSGAGRGPRGRRRCPP